MEGLQILWRAAREVSLWEYALLICVVLVLFLYRTLELHFFQDLLTGFRGHPVQLLCNSSSPLISQVLPHCQALKRRFWPTPWLCSPHLQTAFLHFFGHPPWFDYHRQLCSTPDGGTIALDWLYPEDCLKNDTRDGRLEARTSTETRIAVVIPGLTSDSTDPYMKHIAYNLAASGWKVVVANHRGLGGVSITSNQFYNAGWTEDLRRIINHLSHEYPEALLLAVGTSIGANILVKYLGEEGEKTPLRGAAAICCPWDLLVCDRFICRTWVQRFYDKVLAFGLRSYAAVHQVAFSQIVDWDLISKSRSVRDFDNYCTCVVGQYETVDTYYRKSSSANYLHSVSVPLFCVSALDDPVCTKEAIPWDECRVNTNVVLCLTRHGGHLAFFEGLTAHSIWWVRATTEFLEILCRSSSLHVQKNAPVFSSPSLENGVDKSPFFTISQSGVAAAELVPEKAIENLGELLEEDEEKHEGLQADAKASTKPCVDVPPVHTHQKDLYTPKENGANAGDTSPERDSRASSSACSDNVMMPYHSTVQLQSYSQLVILESLLSQLLEQVQTLKHVGDGWSSELLIPTKRRDKTNIQRDPASSCSEMSTDMQGIHRSGSSFGHHNTKREVPSLKGVRVLARQNQWTLGLLVYVAIVTTWPLVGSALFIHGRRRLKSLLRKVLPK